MALFEPMRRWWCVRHHYWEETYIHPAILARAAAQGGEPALRSILTARHWVKRRSCHRCVNDPAPSLPPINRAKIGSPEEKP